MKGGNCNCHVNGNRMVATHGRNTGLSVSKRTNRKAMPSVEVILAETSALATIEIEHSQQAKEGLGTQPQYMHIPTPCLYSYRMCKKWYAGRDIANM